MCQARRRTHRGACRAAVAALHDGIVALDTFVLAMSTDSRFTHKIWQVEELAKMVEGGVPPHAAGRRRQDRCGVRRLRGANGVDMRGRFIIDPDFVIRAMEAVTPEVGRNPGELVRQIKAFQHVVKTGEVTPSGWEPGQTTLTPAHPW